MGPASVQDIVEVLTSGKRPATPPRLIVVGGGMRTGLSTVRKALVSENFIDPANTVVVTPADFVTMPGYDRFTHIQHPEKTPELVGSYQAAVRLIVGRAVGNQSSILLVDHSEDKAFTETVRRTCKDAGYETLLVGVSAAPQSYYEYANFTEREKRRKADHPRGFLFMRNFASAFRDYTETFDGVTLFESKFSLKDGKPDIALRKIADFRGGAAAGASHQIYDPAAFAAFENRRFLNVSAHTPEEALATLPPAGGAR
jgi:hypothetical protein